MTDSDTYNESFASNIINMFPIKHLCPFCKTGKVYGKNTDDGIVYFERDGEPIKVCNACDEKANPSESMKLHRQVSANAIQEEKLRIDFKIPHDRGVRSWLEEHHGSNYDVNGSMVRVDRFMYQG